MSDIVEELSDKEEKESKSFSFLPLIVFIFLITYLYSILFGEYSINTFLTVKKEKAKIQKEYDDLQKENQKLQKEHFNYINSTSMQDLQ